MSVGISQTQKNIKSRIDALNTYKQVSSDEKDLIKRAGNSLTNLINQSSSQLDKVAEFQKRYLRGAETSLDNLLDFITLTKGSGSSTLKFIKDKMIEAVVTMEPKAVEIITKESLKAVGCSQEQTYPAVSKQTLEIQPISLLPVNQGIYIPVKSIDIGKNLVNNPESDLGKVYYEKPTPSTDPEFVPYGGNDPYPFNKMLYYRMSSSNENRSYKDEFGKFYNGGSQESLFDIVYTSQNDLGINGDFYRVFLLDREEAPVDPSGVTLNNVGQFMKDYYKTINLIDEVDFVAQLTNLLVGAIDIKAQIGFDEVNQKSRFALLIQRILGLCFDNRQEIDVSGISKIGELDGVDESFFEFTEVDLRIIDQRASNIRLGIVQFEECNNISLPVNADQIVEELISYRNSLSGQTTESSVKTINKILDSITENPQWKLLVPDQVGLKLAIDRNIIKQIPLALASTILSPKVLFPIFTMLNVTEINAKNKINSYITSANTFVDSANTFLESGTTVGEQVDNIVDGQVDFVKKFRGFVIEVVSQLNAEFLKILFEILKRDLFLLLNEIVRDINRGGKRKLWTMIIRLLQLSYLIIRGFSDYRKCKSLLDEITLLLSLISSIGPRRFIPLPLLALSELLPGFSPTRAAINVIESLQKKGLPTGPLPDGSPNKMVQFLKSIIEGVDAEESENGFTQIVLDPKLPIRGVGKSF
jgi:hypothetical protein